MAAACLTSRVLPMDVYHVAASSMLALYSAGQAPSAEHAAEFAVVTGMSRALSLATLRSIQSYQRIPILKSLAGGVKSWAQTVGVHDWLAGRSLVQLAAQHSIPPTMLFRWLLPHLQRWAHGARKAGRQDDPLAKLNTHNMSASMALECPSKLGIARLEAEVLEAIAADVFDSPDAVLYRANLGEQFESLLEACLHSAGLTFYTEKHLRKAGASKTPDILLHSPIGIVDSTGEVREVNWMDSKALFGASDQFMADISKQALGYANRYGPGALVFWFGFDADLPGTVARELPGLADDLALCAGLPREFVLPAATSASDVLQLRIPEDAGVAALSALVWPGEALLPEPEAFPGVGQASRAEFSTTQHA